MNFNIHLLLSLLLLLLLLLLLSLFLFYFFFGGVGGGGFRKLNHYGECRFCGYFLGGHHKTRLFWGSFLRIYRSFLSSMYRTGIFLLVAYLLLLLLLLLLLFWGLGVNSRSLV